MHRFPLERYNLSPKRNGKIGKGYIFNNTQFTTEVDDISGSSQHSITLDELKREGSEHDVETLKEIFELMKLEIEKLKHIADKEVTEDDKCVVVAIMTHGSENNIRLKDKECELAKAFKIISECKNLKDKPKVFFIQACRGKTKDERQNKYDARGFEDYEGIRYAHRSGNELNPTRPEESRNEEVSETESVSQLTPKVSDILACYATAKGYVSFRNKTNGARFIQTLGKQLREYFQGQYMEEDFLNLMTKVSSEVAKHPSIEEKVIGGREMIIEMTQMPTYISSLRKKLVFPSVGVATARSDFDCVD